MAFWGEALADGPDLNTAMTEERFARGRVAATSAVAFEARATPAQRRFIDAMALRYRGTWDDWKSDDAAYRDAMAALASKGSAGTDETAALLAAEASFETGGLTWIGTSPASPDARRGLALIENVMARDPDNVMANHLCLHLYDFASDRAPARACAQRLDAAVLPPEGEHLAHMPAHYWIETGHYAAALASSERAYHLFVQLQKTPGRDPDHDRYLPHDVYVGYSAAMMSSDYDAARTWSQRMNETYGSSYDALTALRFGRYADAFALAGDTTTPTPACGPRLSRNRAQRRRLRTRRRRAPAQTDDVRRRRTNFLRNVGPARGPLRRSRSLDRPRGRNSKRDVCRRIDSALAGARSTRHAGIPTCRVRRCRSGLPCRARGVSERSARAGGIGRSSCGVSPQPVTVTPHCPFAERAPVRPARR